MLGWAAVVALLLLLPADVWRSSYQPRGPWVDVVAHAALLGVLGWLAARALAAAGSGRPVLQAALVATLYGALLEGMQHFVPGRAPEAADLLVDALAATAGAWLAAATPSGRARSRGRPASGS